jgi:branched-chain amino acid transport system permease protein
MVRFVTSLIGGLNLGGIYALVAIGLVLAYRATGTFNFAQGQLMVIPAFVVGVWQSEQKAPFLVSFVVALSVSALICLIFYLFVLQRTTGLPHFMGLVATLGLATILDGFIGLQWGANTYVIKFPGLSQGTVTIFGAHIATRAIIITVATLILAVSISALLRFTQIGTQIRAAGQAALLASQGGIRVNVVYMFSWAAAGALAGLAGVAYASTTVVSPSLITVVFAVFPAILLGGLDSVEGAIVGSLLIGVLQGFVVTYLGGEYVDLVTYTLLLVVLLVIPYGLFGTKTATRV